MLSVFCFVERDSQRYTSNHAFTQTEKVKDSEFYEYDVELYVRIIMSLYYYMRLYVRI